MFAPLDGVAVVAEDTWTAIRIARGLEIEWTDSPNRSFDSEALRRSPREAVMKPGTPVPGSGKGDVDAAFAEGGTQVSAVYEMVNGRPRVSNAYNALDCGTHVNPDTCVTQMEGGVAFGLSLTLYGDRTSAALPSTADTAAPDAADLAASRSTLLDIVSKAIRPSR